MAIGNNPDSIALLQPSFVYNGETTTTAATTKTYPIQITGSRFWR